MARILLVEDDPDVRPMMEMTLRSAGHVVDVAATLADARRFVTSPGYDLVLTDGKLPDGNGTEIADEAMRLGIRTLIVSGYLLQLPSADLRRHEILMKPVRPAELLKAIELRLRYP